MTKRRHVVHEHVWVEAEITSGPTMVGEHLTICAICHTIRPPDSKEESNND